MAILGATLEDLQCPVCKRSSHEAEALAQHADAPPLPENRPPDMTEINNALGLIDGAVDDTAPDAEHVGPAIAPDLAPDLAPDVAPDLAPDLDSAAETLDLAPWGTAETPSPGPHARLPAAVGEGDRPMPMNAAQSGFSIPCQD